MVLEFNEVSYEAIDRAFQGARECLAKSPEFVAPRIPIASAHELVGVISQQFDQLRDGLWKFGETVEDEAVAHKLLVFAGVLIYGAASVEAMNMQKGK